MMPFAGNPLDRASDHRADPAWIAARRAEALILPLWKLQVLVTDETAARLEPAQCETLAAPDAAYVFLGLENGRPLFALDISAAENPGLGAFQEMRAAAFVLPHADTAILGQARALIDWHARHRFCANCGSATNFADGGWRRVCPSCAAEHYPRTDPVAIMLPIHGDHCLVGRNSRFTNGLYSVFAGFIEPGENIEEAVRRELKEEAGVDAGAVTYHASQPWPFPSALMIGCYAQAMSRDFKIDGAEIVDARWISKAEIRDLLAGKIEDDVRMPAPIAIAHHLVRDWAGR